MFHIVYSKTDNDYAIVYLDRNGVLRYKRGQTFYSSLHELLQQPIFTAADCNPVADPTWLKYSIYSSPTFPTYEQLITTHPELFI